MDLLEGDTLASIVADAGAELDGVSVTIDGSDADYLRGGSLFAAVRGDALEVCLGPDIAAAAVRTPDTLPSERGSGWVRFAPRHLDAATVDRATAWVSLAWRRAAGRPADR